MNTQPFKHYVFCLLLLSLFSCGKKGSAPTPPTPAPAVDTLTAGWSKKVIGSGVTTTDIFFQNNNEGYCITHVALFRTANGGASWDLTTTADIGNSTNLFVTGNGKLFIANYDGHVYSSSDNGNTFTKYSIPGSPSDLFFTSDDSGYLVTKDLAVYGTSDAGTSWTKLALPAASGANYASLFFIDGKTGWVINETGVYKVNASAQTWIKANGVPVITGNSLTSLYAVSPQIVYAGIADGSLYKSVDGGLNFSLVKNFTASVKSDILDIHFVSNDVGFVSYANKIYKTSDGGISWQTVATLGKGVIIEIHFTDANHGWACGSDGVILRFNG